MAAIKTTLSIPARKPLVPRQAGAPKYDLAALRAGSDDCIVETEVESVKKVQSRLSSAVSSFRKKAGDAGKLMQFAIRSLNVTNEAGQEVTAVGVWRLADKAVAAPAEASATDTAAA